MAALCQFALDARVLGLALVANEVVTTIEVNVIAGFRSATKDAAMGLM